MREITIIPGYLSVGYGRCVEADLGNTISGIVTERDWNTGAVAIVIVGYGIAIAISPTGDL